MIEGSSNRSANTTGLNGDGRVTLRLDNRKFGYDRSLSLHYKARGKSRNFLCTKFQQVFSKEKKSIVIITIEISKNKKKF